MYSEEHTESAVLRRRTMSLSHEDESSEIWLTHTEGEDVRLCSWSRRKETRRERTEGSSKTSKTTSVRWWKVTFWWESEATTSWSKTWKLSRLPLILLISLSLNRAINPLSALFSFLNHNTSPGHAVTVITAPTRPNLVADSCPNLSV